jgi:Glycosyl transferase family 2
VDAASILVLASVAIFVFGVVYAVSTLALMVLSLVEAASIKVERGELFSPPARLRRPGISIIAPAFNTEPLIVANARSLLASDYEPLEVLIVDDGSDDGTIAALQRRFDLVELPVGDRLLSRRHRSRSSTSAASIHGYGSCGSRTEAAPTRSTRVWISLATSSWRSSTRTHSSKQTR